MQPDVSAACQYAFNYLKNGLSADLTYHSLGHTFDDVLPNALRLAELAGVGEEDVLLLRTAAAFHDVGYVHQIIDHEEGGIAISAEILPKYHYTSEQIARIHQMIRATKIPQSPKNLLEKILCDADLDVLGRPLDYAPRCHDLLNETRALGTPTTLLEWYEGQQQFLSAHAYHSDVAKESRNQGKLDNLEDIARWIQELKSTTCKSRDKRDS